MRRQTRSSTGVALTRQRALTSADVLKGPVCCRLCGAEARLDPANNEAASPEVDMRLLQLDDLDRRPSAEAKPSSPTESRRRRFD